MSTIVLATTETQVRWYKFSNLARPAGAPAVYDLVDLLDLDIVPAFADKDSAELAAKALGLKTWRCVYV